MMRVILMISFIPLPLVPTVDLRWVAIISQMVRMARVGMMKATLAAVHTQNF